MAADANALKLEIKVGTDGMVSGLKVATKGVDEATSQFQQSFLTLGGSAREAGEHVEGLGGIIRNYGKDIRTETRFAGFLARDIQNLGIASKSAAGELTQFVAAFSMGGGMGIAIETARTLIKAFTEDFNESQKASDKAVTGIKELQVKVEDYLAGLRGETEAQKLQRKEVKPLLEEKAALIEAARNKTDELAAATNRLAIAQNAHSQAAIGPLRSMVAAKQAELDKLTERIEALNKEIGGKEPAVAQAGAGKEAADARKERKEELRLEFEDLKQVREDENLVSSALLAKDLEARQQAALKAKEIEDKALQEEFDELKKVREDENVVSAQINERDLAQRQKQLKKWVDSVRTSVMQVEGAFAGAFKSILTGGKNVGDALIGVFQNLAEMAIDALLKMVAEMIIGAITGKAAAKLEALSTTHGHIAEAVAGAAASQAFIPFIGPELAAAAAAEMGSTLEAATAPLLATASGGFDVPAGVNPLTQLHAREMVLPEQYADVIRGLSPGDGGGDTYQVTIQAMDAASFEDSLRRNATPFLKVMRQLNRNGRL